MIRAARQDISDNDSGMPEKNKYLFSSISLERPSVMLIFGQSRHTFENMRKVYLTHQIHVLEYKKLASLNWYYVYLLNYGNTKIDTLIRDEWSWKIHTAQHTSGQCSECKCLFNLTHLLCENIHLSYNLSQVYTYLYGTAPSTS